MRRLIIIIGALAVVAAVAAAGLGYHAFGPHHAAKTGARHTVPAPGHAPGVNVMASPPETPARNVGACHTARVTALCEQEALVDFNKARAKEGLGPMQLPDNFRSLTAPQQLLVLANIDRTDRGLPPIQGISKALQPYANAGARRGGDPNFPSWTRAGGSNWASGANSLLDEFLWMYDDGPGRNLDCPSAGAKGCWGHRHNILRGYPAPIMMGAGHGPHGDTQLFLGADKHDRPSLFRWSREESHFGS